MPRASKQKYPQTPVRPFEPRALKNLAQCLIVSSVISLVFAFPYAAVMSDLTRMGSGNFHGPPDSDDTRNLLIYGGLVVIPNLLILIGGIQTWRLRSLGLARLACLASLIPCFVPCVPMGMVVGVMGLRLLWRPEAQEIFIN